jgi:hypothetical protein
MEKHRGRGLFSIARLRHTAPFLRLFVPNSLTVHHRSISLKAVLAASPFCPATSCSNYSPAVTSSTSFLGLFVPNNSMVQHRITFTLHFHSLWGGRCFCVTGSSNMGRFSFFVLVGDTSTVPNPWFVVPEGADTLTTSSSSAIRNCVAVPLHLGFSCPLCISVATDVSSRTSVVLRFLVPCCPWCDLSS